MGRAPVASKVPDGGLNKGPWTEEEDAILTAFIKAHGEGNWRTLPKLAGIETFCCRQIALSAIHVRSAVDEMWGCS